MGSRDSRGACAVWLVACCVMIAFVEMNYCHWAGFVSASVLVSVVAALLVERVVAAYWRDGMHHALT